MKSNERGSSLRRKSTLTLLVHEDEQNEGPLCVLVHTTGTAEGVLCAFGILCRHNRGHNDVASLSWPWAIVITVFAIAFHLNEHALFSSFRDG